MQGSHNGADFDSHLKEIYSKLNFLSEKHSETATRIDNVESFMQTLSENIGKVANKLDVLDDIKIEIHNLREAVLRPLIKALIVLVLGLGALLVVVTGVAIGIREFHASPTNGLSFQSHKDQ